MAALDPAAFRRDVSLLNDSTTTDIKVGKEGFKGARASVSAQRWHASHG
jgi:hypothetical protein